MTDTTSEKLLTDLGELHTRTHVSPLPTHPAAFGWQMTAGAMAALAARLLHNLQQVAPEQAQQIAYWFDGPFGEGPDSEEHTDWLERTVAESPAVLEKWVEEGQQAAVNAKQATLEWEQKQKAAGPNESQRDIHTHMGLSYANYLVLPRTLLQSMQAEWQDQFVALLEQMNEVFEHVPQAEAYEVTAGAWRTVSDMTAQELSQCGITKEVMGNGDARYFDENWNDQDPNEAVFVEGADPVPHYNRGRTRVEPRLNGAA